MNFQAYLLEIEKIDKELYACVSLPENIIRLNSQINKLEMESSENAQAIKQLKIKKVALEQELAEKKVHAERLIEQILTLTREQHGSEARSCMEQIIHNIKINRKIIPDPNPISPEEYRLPADLLGVVPEANNHGFRLKTYKNLLAFTKLAYAIERNGIPEEHAYKLAIMFDNPDPKQGDLMKNVLQYWRMVAMENEGNPQFLHDSCLFELPRGSGWTVESWRGFVRSDLQNFAKGNRGIALCLSEAERIEERLLAKREEVKKKEWIKKRQAEVEKRAKKSTAATVAQPKTRGAIQKNPEQLWQEEWQKQRANVLSQCNIKDIIDMHSSLTFTRGAENPEAASLFRKYGMSEVDYNKYQELKPKDSDRIPNIIVGGERIAPELKNYYIKKLDPRDPMCAALGKKTGCCQSMGGAGEACAIHGITSEHGGFYVLCAGDPKNPKPTDDIRAQCWAWRSKTGALVFDSIEATKPIRESTVGNYRGVELISLMYAQLAFDLVENPQFGIDAVNVGVGGLGATPDMLGIFNATIEHPIDYKDYRDSMNQRMIADRANIKTAKKFYEILNNLILYSRSPNSKTESKLTDSFNELSFEDSIYILGQLILYDKSKNIIKEELVYQLLDIVTQKHAATLNSKSVVMITSIKALIRDDNQLQRAKRLSALYDVGLDIRQSFCFPEDVSGTVMSGNKNMLEVLLKAGDWASVNHLLDLGMKIQGNAMLWALGDVSQFPIKEKKLEPEQIQVIRRLMKAGANCNVEASWWNDQILTPLDVLIMSGNEELVDEFLAMDLDKTKGQPIATASSLGKNELMMKLIDQGFSAAKGDVIAAYIGSSTHAQIEKIEELIRLGANAETTNALFGASLPHSPPDLAMQLVERNIGLSKESLNSIFAHLVREKRYEVLNRVVDKVTTFDEITFDNEYSQDTSKIGLLPKTSLIRLIEDNQYDLAKRIIEQGANLEVQPATFPEDQYSYLKENKTNFVVATCLKQQNEQATLLALDMIAKGAPFTGVDLHLVEGGQELGDRLVALAQQTNNQKALERLKREGFAQKMEVRVKPVKFTVVEQQVRNASSQEVVTQDAVPTNPKSKPG